MGTEISGINGVIFDLDGTIFDDIPYILNLHVKIAGYYDFPLTDELDKLLRENTSIPICTSGSSLEIFKAMNYLGKKINLTFLRRIKMMLRIKNEMYDYIKNCPLIDGSQEILQFLSENNVKIGMFTNSSRSEIEIIFNGQKDILKYFEGNIISRNDVKHRKPHPEGIFKLINKWGISPQNVMIFGDYKLDIQAGKEAGITTVGVLSGVGDLEHFKRCKADYIIQDISEIPVKFPKLSSKN